MDKITEIAKLNEEIASITGPAKVTITQIPKKKKVCIMGFAPSWPLTPWDNPDFEIWTCNEAYKLLNNVPNARVDRWFEIHDPNSPSKKKEEHWNFLKTCGIPLYMQKHYDEFPTSIAYPRDEVKAMFNENFIESEVGGKFTEWSNQITWMIALAIYEGFEEIWVTGVDMAQRSEYNFQRASCQALIGYAAGKGIKVLIPKTSELCKAPKDYGFDTDNQQRHYIKGRKKDLQDRIQQIQGQIAQLQQHKEQINQKINGFTAQIYQLQGAIGEIDHNLENNIV